MKSFRRTLSPITKPFSYVHKTLVGLGFRKLENKSKPLYHLIFRNPETNQSYTLYVSAQTLDNGQAEVMLPTARFEQENHVPLSVMEAAQSKLIDVADYLEQHRRKDIKIEDVSNGRMATSEEEIWKLGKEMKHMKTNSELLDEGLIPDPIQ